MNKLIIIRGNSGSGKTTIAKRLRYEMGDGTMLIPQDVIRREILQVSDEPNNPSIDLITQLAYFGKGLNYDVIIEGILPTHKYGKMLDQLLNKFETTHVFYLEVTFEETLRRHQTKTNAYEFNEKKMKEWWIERNYLGVPGEVIIGQELSEDEALELMLNETSAS